jgi:hypothetical protein
VATWNLRCLGGAGAAERKLDYLELEVTLDLVGARNARSDHALVCERFELN